MTEKFRPRRLLASMKLVPLIVALLAVLPSRAFGAIDQGLFTWDAEDQLGSTPQIDHHGNLLTLIDFGGGVELLKQDANGNVVWEIPMPSDFLLPGSNIAIDASDNVYVDSYVVTVINPSVITITKISSSGSILSLFVGSGGSVS